MSTAWASDDRRVAAVEVNPYAAPQVGDAAEPLANAGIGVWRDGGELVMHEDASLPALCIRCAEPASHWRSRVLRWPLVSRWRLKLRLPICRRCSRWRAASVFVGTPIFFLALGLCFATFPGFVAFGWWKGEVPFTTLRMCVALFCLSVGALASTIAFANTFDFAFPHVRRRGRYHWFRGPWGRTPDNFLNHLPEWPHGK